jgi:hypothetical protein
VHDARIAALCRLHGIREFCSADRDFSRFPDLPQRNPLIPRAASAGQRERAARRPLLFVKPFAFLEPAKSQTKKELITAAA